MAMLTEAGTVAEAELLDSVIVSGKGAGALSVTKPVAVAPPTTEEGVNVRVGTAGALISSVPLAKFVPD